MREPVILPAWPAHVLDFARIDLAVLDPFVVERCAQARLLVIDQVVVALAQLVTVHLARSARDARLDPPADGHALVALILTRQQASFLIPVLEPGDVAGID